MDRAGAVLTNCLGRRIVPLSFRVGEQRAGGESRAEGEQRTEGGTAASGWLQSSNRFPECLLRHSRWARDSGAGG